MFPRSTTLVELPAGRYTLGEPGEERAVELARVLIGRYPVVNAHARRRRRRQARRSAARRPSRHRRHARRGGGVLRVRRQLGAAPPDRRRVGGARARRRRAAPIRGATRSTRRAATAPRAAGAGPSRSPRTRHGAGPFGAEQLAGNVWEWVADRTPDGWGVVRGGSYLDTGWGLRAARAQPADPARATRTTGFRIAIDPTGGVHDETVPPSSTRCGRSTTPAARTAASRSSTWASWRTSASTARTSTSTSCSRRAGARSWRRCRARSRTRCKRVDGVETVDVQVVWDPVWTMDRLSESAREKLAMPLEELEPYRAGRSAA